MARRQLKHPVSDHAYQRFKERLKIENLLSAEWFCYNANKYGLNPVDFSGDFKSWLENKGRFKRLKVYRGYVVVFAKSSNYVYTIYKVPDMFMNIYKEQMLKRKFKL